MSNNQELVGACGSDAPLPQRSLGALELLTYFPHHTQWPMVMVRLKGRGWTNDDIARYTFYARGAGGKDYVDRRAGALRHQTTKAGREFFNDPSYQESQNLQSLKNVADQIGHDATRYRRPNNQATIGDPTLFSLSRGVVNEIALGPDRGAVAQVIMWAKEHDKDETFRISDISALIMELKIEESPEAGNLATWDANGLDRAKTTMHAAGY